MKKLAIIILPLLAVPFFYGYLVHRDISDAVVRLHIVANSNEKADQAVKLAVRDEVLRLMREDFTKTKDKAAFPTFALIAPKFLPYPTEFLQKTVFHTAHMRISEKDILCEKPMGILPCRKAAMTRLP